MVGRVWRAIKIAARLGCPRCGAPTLFRGPFTMNERCARCHLVFEREPGYFIGAIYINYAATVIPIVAGFLLLDAFTGIGLMAQLVLWSCVGVVLPIFFYRYSRSFWLGLDHLFNPPEPDIGLADHRA
jgi:uncharacterized protein (DUF983 family)